MSLLSPGLRRRCWPRPHSWIHVQARTYASPATSNTDEDWVAKLRTEMLSRPIVATRECVNTDTHHKLADSLSSFLPAEWSKRLTRGRSTVPLGHTLVWFNASMPVDQLLPDGTDPQQSPGGPWVRRMWTGGSLELKKEVYHGVKTGLVLDTDMIWAERIRDVQLRGSGDTAKIVVNLERRYARLDKLREKLSFRLPGDRRLDPQGLLREQMVQGVEWGDAVLREERNLIFLREKTVAELEAASAGHFASPRYLDSPGRADFSHSLTPTRSLLFRYSALTFNAHLIHLDRHYAQHVEGHRNLLVHGPLSLTLMLQVMQGYLEKKIHSRLAIESIRYKNLAPLYCDEEMKICIKKKEAIDDGATHDIWIEGPSGGVAVKGAVRVGERMLARSVNRVPPGNTSEHELESKFARWGVRRIENTTFRRVAQLEHREDELPRRYGL